MSPTRRVTRPAFGSSVALSAGALAVTAGRGRGRAAPSGVRTPTRCSPATRSGCLADRLRRCGMAVARARHDQRAVSTAADSAASLVIPSTAPVGCSATCHRVDNPHAVSCHVLPTGCRPSAGSRPSLPRGPSWPRRLGEAVSDCFHGVADLLAHARVGASHGPSRGPDVEDVGGRDGHRQREQPSGPHGFGR